MVGRSQYKRTSNNQVHGSTLHEGEHIAKKLFQTPPPSQAGGRKLEDAHMINVVGMVN